MLHHRQPGAEGLCQQDQGKKQQGAKIREEWKFFILHLSSTISELKGTTGLHYRGQTYIPADTHTLKPGMVMAWPAFTSCSTNKGVAINFSKGKLLYEIRIPSEYGGNIKEYSVYQGEDELVFPPFTSFRVDSA